MPLFGTVAAARIRPMKHHRVLIAGLLLVSAAAACASGVAETRHQSALGTELLHLLPAVAEAMAGLAWAGMGAAAR